MTDGTQVEIVTVERRGAGELDWGDVATDVAGPVGLLAGGV
jgi:hypothetical protein